MSEFEIYYKTLFPFEDFYRWLSYGSRSRFERREFAFSIEKYDEEIFIRNRTFDNAIQLGAEIRNLKPTKIHMGAIYNIRPTKFTSDLKYVPMEKELIIDIDITEYDDARSCCADVQICPKCWKFMVLACKILDDVLRTNFGFHHILWTYSGRRGIHCWVCDKRARSLTSSERRALANYIQVVNGRRFMFEEVKLHTNMTNLLSPALALIRPIFVPFIVEEQDLLGTDKGITNFLNMFSDDEHRKALRSQMEMFGTSRERWNTFVSYVENVPYKNERKTHEFTYLIDEVMLLYTYPRIDTNVTVSVNHLLKVPFSIHPKTGKISVPFSVDAVDKFPIDNVPTIEMLNKEIKEIDLKKGECLDDKCAERRNYKTSLDPALTVFREFITNLEDDT